MKTPEETLEQWVANRIHFYGGYNPRGKEFWTRDELELVAAIVRSDTDWTARFTSPDFRAIFDAVREEALREIGEAKIGGPPITAQYLAMFDSLDELTTYLRSKGWLDEATETGI